MVDDLSDDDSTRVDEPSDDESLVGANLEGVWCVFENTLDADTLHGEHHKQQIHRPNSSMMEILSDASSVIVTTHATSIPAVLS